MAIVRVFKSRVPFCKYLFKNGKEANFIGGVYTTDIETEIEELDTEIKLKHPTLFIDASDKERDTEKIDPLDEIRRKAVADYLAGVAAATNKSNDRGTTEQGRLNVANSSTIAEASAGSDSSNGASIVAGEAASGLQAASAAALKAAAAKLNIPPAA